MTACLLGLTSCATTASALHDYRAPDAPESGAGHVELATDPDGAVVTVIHEGAANGRPSSAVLAGDSPLHLDLAPGHYSFTMTKKENDRGYAFVLHATVEAGALDRFDISMGRTTRQELRNDTSLGILATVGCVVIFGSLSASAIASFARGDPWPPYGTLGVAGVALTAGLGAYFFHDWISGWGRVGKVVSHDRITAPEQSRSGRSDTADDSRNLRSASPQERSL